MKHGASEQTAVFHRHRQDAKRPEVESIQLYIYHRLCNKSVTKTTFFHEKMKNMPFFL